MNRILGTSLAVAIGVAMIAAPASAVAQSRSKEDEHRRNAYILGAAGLILNSTRQKTLGTIALAGAAYEAYRMQSDIEKRQDRERYGYYDRNGRWVPDTSRTRYGSSSSGYYDRDGRWHPYTTNRTDGYYDREGRWHAYRTSRDRYDDDDRNCNKNGKREQRGRDWAATRGKKKGWEKNGKR